AIRRVALLSNERSRAVKFSVDANRVEVASHSPELGEAHEQIVVDYSGPAMQISFNAQYVLEFLNVVETDTIAIELKDEVSQTVMRPIGTTGYDYTYVVMPMRI
ncbi:MAG: DNA polymerase III subunit beta, partial [Acidobacteriota bacterium]